VCLQAAVSALKQFPAVNAVIDGDDIIYRDYVDISIAVGTAKVKSFEVDVKFCCHILDCHQGIFWMLILSN